MYYRSPIKCIDFKCNAFYKTVYHRNEKFFVMLLYCSSIQLIFIDSNIRNLISSIVIYNVFNYCYFREIEISSDIL